jgi:hypothetical protein
VVFISLLDVAVDAGVDGVLAGSPVGCADWLQPKTQMLSAITLKERIMIINSLAGRSFGEGRREVKFAVPF